MAEVDFETAALAFWIGDGSCSCCADWDTREQLSELAQQIWPDLDYKAAREKIEPLLKKMGALKRLREAREELAEAERNL